MNLLSNDSMLGRMFDFLGHLILLNLLWILTCIPIITIGPATTALYYSVLKMHKGTASSAWKDYIKSLKENFRQSLVAGILLTAVGLVLYLEYGFLTGMEGPASGILTLAVLAVFVLWYILVLYLFPVISAFSNSLGRLTGHACFFAFRHLLYLLPIGAVSFFPMYFTMVDAAMFPFYLFFWLSLGFSLTAWLNGWFFYRMFKPHLEKVS